MKATTDALEDPVASYEYKRKVAPVTLHFRGDTAELVPCIGAGCWYCAEKRTTLVTTTVTAIPSSQSEKLRNDNS